MKMPEKFYYIKLLYLYVLVWLTLASSGLCADLRSLPSVMRNKLGLESGTLPFEDCGSEYDVLYVGVSGCSTIPCKMVRGSTVMVTVIFYDNGDQTAFLRHNVRWILNAIKTNAVISPDPCVNNDACLSEANRGKSYTAQVLVSSNLPNIRGTMMWEAVDQNDNEVICFKIPVIITL